MSLPIYIDIDGTLTDTPTKPWGEVIESRIDTIRDWIRNGHEVVLWTGGGTTYAKAFAEKYGLQDCTCVGKPGCMVDDNPTVRPEGRIAVLAPDKFFGEGT